VTRIETDVTRVKNPISYGRRIRLRDFKTRMLQDAATFPECLLLTNESDEEGEELLHQHHNVAD
jgi:hypothetical protein